MRKKNRHTRLRLFLALMCIFTASFSLIYTGLDKKADRVQGAGSYSDTLYMALKGDSAEPVISFDREEKTEKGAVAAENAEAAASEDAAKAETATASESTESNRQAANTGTPFVFSGIKTVKVLMSDTGEIREMPLDEYTACALVAEMPPDAPVEALKAQAVACRTLAVNLILKSDKGVHLGADICTSPSHCQAFASEQDYILKYGDAATEIFKAARNAAKATTGIIMLYNSQPIVAAFHASSGDFTASSAEVWGGNLDYLVSVETHENKNASLHRQVYGTVSITGDEFISRLERAGVSGLSQYSGVPFVQWVSGVSRTPSGRVDFMEIGGKTVSGGFLQSILGLKSCDFSVSFSEDTITFTTQGYGHGVGMSQLGAVTMAQGGSDFYEILTYYYPGISFGIAG